jgi:hypothetical protein
MTRRDYAPSRPRRGNDGQLKQKSRKAGYPAASQIIAKDARQSAGLSGLLALAEADSVVLDSDEEPLVPLDDEIPLPLRP